MLEEKNDNLLNTDGDLVNPNTVNEVSELVDEISEPEVAIEEQLTESVDIEVENLVSTTESNAEEISDEIQQVEELEELGSRFLIDEVEQITHEQNEEVVSEINQVEVTKEIETIDLEESAAVLDEVQEMVFEENKDVVSETNHIDAVEAIVSVNAEESEDESLKERHEIPMVDYDMLSMEEMIVSLETLVASDKIMSVKDHVEEIKKSFLAKYYHFIDEKKEEFLNENPDTTEEFTYHYPAKVKFDQLYTSFKEKRNIHFKSLQNSLKQNLENRLKIVEELKYLIHSQDSISNTLKQFNEIRDRWKVAGPIPKDKYNHVWNNYHFHLENFYDVLHLDREIRDLDFKNNLEQKLKIIARVEELVNENDISNSFRELQDLHRIWKEEIGPVSRDKREEIWNRFSDLTKQMHDKREAYFEKFREIEQNNLIKKKEIIEKIAELAKEKVDSHTAWIGQISKIEALRNEFFSTGKVPTEVNEDTWSVFKNEVRNFNVLKNSFYKDIKKDQNDNLSKKQALVDKAIELKDSTDFVATTPLMKQIQEEWKTIGHVPRKFSDKLWVEFRTACNHYFENSKKQRTELDADEVEAFDKKKEYLETLKSFELVGEHKTDLDAIKLHIETWKSFGKVPFTRRHIEGKFNKILDVLFDKLSSSKKENEKIRYANRLDNLAHSDTRRLDNEKVFVMRKIEEVQNEIFQLENNIQFFSNAKSDNPLVKEVLKNIDKHKEELISLKDKLKQIKNLKID